jgi:peptidoglycan/LPS O-acetylase OafA/YrhL
MVAILTVFANHLWGWPGGGFIGVDVFFVISGFLITGNLLRMAQTRGTVSFLTFYWNRVRRIVPAATVVLVLTYLASVLVFLPFRAQEVGVDALFAFVFMSNWWFAYKGTDYFRAAADSVSPIQHYWSLSIEEQFYFVWPALIFVIGLVVLRKAWTHERRMQTAGAVMGVIIALSLGWALWETSTSATWAYFNTLSRVWELGVGALLATAVGPLARISEQVRPAMSWGGLGMIAAGVVLISDDWLGFPAPLALLPVVGAVLVIAAGVGGEPRYQAFLRNPVSGYIGDISYSLYLVHWPVIVILGSLMDVGTNYYLAVLALGFGLAIASYHLVENPLRRADSATVREAVREIRKRRYHSQPSSGYAALAALTLIAVGAVAYVARPEAYEHTVPPLITAVTAAATDEVDPSGTEPQLGPLTAALQGEIAEALQATEWPRLDPPMETVLASGLLAEVADSRCTVDAAAPPEDVCTSGSPDAPVKLVLVGDSIALGYANPLREIALNSGGQIQLHNLAMGSCSFANDLIDIPNMKSQCAARKQYAVDFINTIKPTAVIISNFYGSSRVVGSPDHLGPAGWADSVRQIVEKFRDNTEKVVLLSPPPGNVDIKDCYSKRSSTPADCIGRVVRQWTDIAAVERDLAETIGGAWIDSRPWFCSSGRMCPAFVGTTASKVDEYHMTPTYGKKIYPVIQESFAAAGVF